MHIYCISFLVHGILFQEKIFKFCDNLCNFYHKITRIGSHIYVIIAGQIYFYQNSSLEKNFPATNSKAHLPIWIFIFAIYFLTKRDPSRNKNDSFLPKFWLSSKTGIMVKSEICRNLNFFGMHQQLEFEKKK